MHQLYRRPMANPLLIMARSMIPEKVKRTTLTRQALRILRNTTLDLPEKEKSELLLEFSARVRASGYGTRYRQEIITSAMMANDRMRKEQEDGGRPINRPRSYLKLKRDVRRNYRPKPSGSRSVATRPSCLSLSPRKADPLTCCKKWRRGVVQNVSGE